MVNTIEKAENGPGDAYDVESFRSAFDTAMNDDFNSAQGIAVLFEHLKELRKRITNGSSPSNLDEVKAYIRKVVDGVMGIWPSGSGDGKADVTEGLVQLLIEIRKEARANKDFALSDKIRDDLKELGVQLMDGKDGTTFEID